MNQTNHTRDRLSTESPTQAQIAAGSSNQTPSQLTASMNKEIIILELLTFPALVVLACWLYLKFDGGSLLSDIHPLLTLNPTTNALAAIAVLILIGKTYLSFKIRRKYRKLRQQV